MRGAYLLKKCRQSYDFLLVCASNVQSFTFTAIGQCQVQLTKKQIDGLAVSQTLKHAVPLTGFAIFFIFFSVRLLSVLHGHLVFSPLPQRPMTSDFEGFLYQIVSITLFSYFNS